MDNQKELEQLIDKIMNNDVLDSPSADFTKNVMASLSVERSPYFVYKPLLPKYIFAVVAVVFVALIFGIFNFYGITETNPRYLESLNEASSRFTELFAQIRFSKTIGYIIFFAGLMFCVQTVLLKKHFDSRFA